LFAPSNGVQPTVYEKINFPHFRTDGQLQNRSCTAIGHLGILRPNGKSLKLMMTKPT